MDLSRPRDVFHIHETPGFADLYDALWDDIRSEIERSRERRGVDARQLAG